MNDKQLTSGKGFLDRIFQAEKDRERERKERELECKKIMRCPSWKIVLKVGCV